MCRTKAVIIASSIAVVVAACGGGSSGNGGQTPPPSGGGGTGAANPCTTAAAEAAELGPVGIVAGGQAGTVANKKIIVDGNSRGGRLEAMWLHDAAEKQRQERSRGLRDQAEGAARDRAITSPAPVAEDIGDIAVLQDQGDLVAGANQFDIANAGFRFTRNGASGYNVSKIDGTFRTTLGARLSLTDDDSAEVDSVFAFPFYGGTQTVTFVNSDGNITFGEADKASTDRSVSRLLSGPPRVSPFLSDLDPTTPSGKIFVNAAADQYTVTWCTVHGFDSGRTVTAQATLLPDGTIEFKYETVSVRDAVVGLSPGRADSFTTMNLSVPDPASGTGALGERFSESPSIDTIAVARKFYQTHPDSYDQILLWTDQRLLAGGTFAYEQTVANEIRGLGVDIYDQSRDYGSGGRLRSVVVMDFVGKYPDDPSQKFLGENNTVSVMGQEVGHRWLAYLDFRDHTGARSDVLLGRDLAHWSFFFDSDASVMEGNDIEDLGGGQFRTVGAVSRYSRLDQYAMGLVPASSVATFFYVEDPVSTHVREDAPQIGVTFSGTRRDVLIDDVIAVLGQRSPTSAESPRVHRQAFILLVSAGRSTDAAQVAKVDGIRRAWEPFFFQATERRMTARTTLR
jgi:hypothetical protein